MTTHTDDTLTDVFARIDFAGEPPMHTSAHDDARRGRRGLRRRRTAAAAGGVLGVSVVATTTALVVSAGSSGIAPLDRDTAVMAPPPAVAEEPAPELVDDGLPYLATRTVLLDAAQEHLDPAGDHLPATLADVGNAQSGGAQDGTRIGAKLGWSIDHETGLGMVRVAATTAGYVDAAGHAFADFALALDCDIEGGACVEGTLPGTDLHTWVAQDSRDVALSVILERADGSLVGVTASDLFGNNSTEPVSDIGITLEQAYAFVADPDIAVDPADAAEVAAKAEARLAEVDGTASAEAEGTEPAGTTD